MEAPVISSDSEPLILVNEQDEPVGSMPKRECHLGDGVLHRAFSIFVFNRAGDVLLQRRSDQKFLWPGFWSNACCSHPRDGESSEDAAQRRLTQELGIDTRLLFLYKFVYRASFRDVGSEHELCWVWAGVADESEVTVNANEVAEWRYFPQAELDQALTDTPEEFTPWMKMEWQTIRQEHWESIERELD